MSFVKPKKFLGQHFLIDEEIALKITEALLPAESNAVLEIGPGMGVLTKYLIRREGTDLKVIEIDRESIAYLKKNFPELPGRIIEGDFLHTNPAGIFSTPYSIIGNFPYNISSQILFRVLKQKELVLQVVGMFQKEVAKRICAVPKTKDYGILSVFMQAYYDTEYLFTVDEHVFNPPPKVKSGVIRLIQKKNFVLEADEQRFFQVVKTAFNQRRKTMRNALKSLLPENFDDEKNMLSRRAEELSWQEFVDLTNRIFPDF